MLINNIIDNIKAREKYMGHLFVHGGFQIFNGEFIGLRTLFRV